MLLVARCGGSRCAGLLGLARVRSAGDPVAAAVADRRDGLLLRTPCLGPCHRGALAATGWARGGGQRLTWEGSPSLRERIDTAGAAGSLAAWIAETASPHPSRG